MSLNISYVSLESGISIVNSENDFSLLRSVKWLSKNFRDLNSSTFREHPKNESLSYWIPETLFSFSFQTLLTPEWCFAEGSWEQLRPLNCYLPDFSQKSLCSYLPVFCCFSGAKRTALRTELTRTFQDELEKKCGPEKTQNN